MAEQLQEAEGQPESRKTAAIDASGSAASGGGALALAAHILCRDVDFESSVRLALDAKASRRTVGALTGLLVGARDGIDAVPPHLKQGILEAAVIEGLTRDAGAWFSVPLEERPGDSEYGPTTGWRFRYPRV